MQGIFANSIGASQTLTNALALGKSFKPAAPLVDSSSEDEEDDARHSSDEEMDSDEEEEDDRERLLSSGILPSDSENEDDDDDDEEDGGRKKRKMRGEGEEEEKPKKPLTGAELRILQKQKKKEEEEKGGDAKKKKKEEEEKKKKEAEERKKERVADPTKDARTIFVGNLAMDASEKDVKKQFAEFGEIESIRFRSIATKYLGMEKKGAVLGGLVREGVNHKNCYLVFKNEESATRATSLDGREINGRHLRIDRVGEKLQKAKNSRLSVFVGNLPLDVDEEELRAFFAANCPGLTSVRVVRDNATLIGKGFGFVAFENIDGVEAALKMEGKKFKSRPLRVMRATNASANPKTAKKQNSHNKNNHNSNKKRTNNNSNNGGGAAAWKSNNNGGGGGERKNKREDGEEGGGGGKRRRFDNNNNNNNSNDKKKKFSKEKQIHKLTAVQKSQERKAAGKAARKERRAKERAARGE